MQSNDDNKWRFIPLWEHFSEGTLSLITKELTKRNSPENYALAT